MDQISPQGTAQIFPHPFTEILFYKKWKPWFTAEAEYYQLLYQAALFKPADPGSTKSFWNRELQRIEAILNHHQVFFSYWQTGRTDQDLIYFNQASGSLDYFLWDKGLTKTEHPYDLLLSYLQALLRYRYYVQGQLKI